MPHATESEFDYIVVRQLAPTVGAEVTGIDFSKPVPPDVFAEVHRAITRYGVLVFRHAALDDASHVAFAAQFGELDDIRPYLSMGRKQRLPFLELFDVSNLEDDGSLVAVGSKRDHMGRGNSIFHVDSSFNPRRAGFSLLRAHSLPPSGSGGNTDFADTRAAFDELPADLMQHLKEQDYVAAHSLMHSRKKAAPDSEWLRDVDPEKFPFGRHKILQVHEASGRGNLYVANHIHHLEYPGPERKRVPEAEGMDLIERLLSHCSQDKYVLSVPWQEEGDVVVWDNTCVMHKAGDGTFMGKYARDMRRCTVHDGSSQAWGLNDRSTERAGLP